jgi:hypothetical protein
MNYKDLLDASKAHLGKYPGAVAMVHSGNAAVLHSGNAAVSHPGKAAALHPGKAAALHAGKTAAPRPANMFPSGARWMFDRLNELDGTDNRVFNTAINYNLYGGLKYGVCLAGTFLFIAAGLRYSYWCVPLAVVFFYLLEVHFLFLFPLLIDNTKHPLRTGIRSVYGLGLLSCLFTVIPIAIFMLLGLLRKQDALRNWLIGCLAILIWYNNAIRKRM